MMKTAWTIQAIGLLAVVVAPVWYEPPTKDDEPLSVKGATNPELIPDWLIWTTAFNRIAMSREHSKDRGSTDQSRQAYVETIHGFQRAAGLTPTDLQVFEHEAKLQDQRERNCRARMESARENVRSKHLAHLDDMDTTRIEDIQKKLNTELDTIAIACRQETLDAGNRVLERISPEGQASLLAELHASRRTSWFTLPKKAMLKQFLLPR